MKQKPLIANRNNIETYLPVFKGFYGSFWDEPDFYGEAEHFGLPNDFPFWEYVDWAAYKEDLSKKFCHVVEREMSDFIERIDFQSLQSPKEYNFENDSINCIIRPKKVAIKEYIYANREAFEKYLEDHLKSRSGFISFHSYHFEDWETATKKFTKLDNKDITLGFILDFIVENTELDVDSSDHVCQNFYEVEDCISNFYNKDFDAFVENFAHISEFITTDGKKAIIDKYEDSTDFKAQVEEVRNFVHRNYNTQNLLDVVTKTFESFEYVDFEAIVDSIMTKVASHTLKLQLK